MVSLIAFGNTFSKGFPTICSTDRFNKVRPIVDRDFSKTSKVGGAPKDSKYKITFKKSKAGTLPAKFEGTKYYKSKSEANQALKDKQKFILEAREKRKKPPKIVDPKEYAEDVRTRKPGVGLKKISTITKDNVVTKTYKDRATGKVTKKYSSKFLTLIKYRFQGTFCCPKKQ